jgi:hypothetical protein
MGKVIVLDEHRPEPSREERIAGLLAAMRENIAGLNQDFAVNKAGPDANVLSNISKKTAALWHDRLAAFPPKTACTHPVTQALLPVIGALSQKAGFCRKPEPVA